jgi:hypothetical protein
MVNNKIHLINGPAFIDMDHTAHWYQNGKKHRVDGPAVIPMYSTLELEWWLNGEKVDLISEYFQYKKDNPGLFNKVKSY